MSFFVNVENYQNWIDEQVRNNPASASLDESAAGNGAGMSGETVVGIAGVSVGAVALAFAAYVTLKKEN